MRTTTLLRSLLAFFGAFVATAFAAPFAYIPHDAGVAIIDVEARAKIGNIALAQPLRGVAFVPNDPRGFVATSGRIHIVDTRAQVVVSFMDTPQADFIARNPGLPRAYVLGDHCLDVTGPCTPSIETSLRVVDTETGTLLGQRPAGNIVDRAAFNRAGTRGYLSDRMADRVHVLDTGTDVTLASIATPDGPRGLVAHPSLNRLYVAQFGFDAPGNTVSVVDLDSNSVIASIAVGTAPSDLALTPSGGRLFVTNRFSNSVSVIDTVTNTVVATIPVGSTPEGIDITPDGEAVYVVNNGSGSVSIISTDTLRVLQTVDVGSGAHAVGRFIGGFSPTAGSLPGVLTGLWWRSTEPGWGLHVTSRGNNIFAVWYDYGPGGHARWYVSSNCEFDPPLACPSCVQNAQCTGRALEFTGPPFIGRPFRPDQVRGIDVGHMRLRFFDAHNGAFTYNVRHKERETRIERQVFAAGPVAGVDYTDLWWNPGESGWGLGVTHQGNVMFLTWFIYDDEGNAQWYVASNCTVNAAGNGCSGELYLTKGPLGPTGGPSFDSSRVQITTVGRVELAFTDPNNGMFSYRIGDVGVTKAITRQFF